jgi:hypothetical protein
MNVWMIIAFIAIALSFYLAIRVYRLRKELTKILVRLAQIERKVLVLKP